MGCFIPVACCKEGSPLSQVREGDSLQSSVSLSVLNIESLLNYEAS